MGRTTVPRPTSARRDLPPSTRRSHVRIAPRPPVSCRAARICGVELFGLFVAIGSLLVGVGQLILQFKDRRFVAGGFPLAQVANSSRATPDARTQTRLSPREEKTQRKWGLRAADAALIGATVDNRRSQLSTRLRHCTYRSTGQIAQRRPAVDLGVHAANVGDARRLRRTNLRGRSPGGHGDAPWRRCEVFRSPRGSSHPDSSSRSWDYSWPR
jgi:hypothetical protein